MGVEQGSYMVVLPKMDNQMLVLETELMEDSDSRTLPDIKKMIILETDWVTRLILYFFLN